MGKWPFLLLVLLLGCGQPQSGGTSGTESDNALTIRAWTQATTANEPDWVVRVWPEGQIPDTLGTSPSFRDSVGPDGKAHLLVPSGRWSVLVTFRGLGYRTVAAGADTIADTLRLLQSITGTVVGGGGDWVFLPGMGRAIKCSTTGDFQVDSLPQGVVPVAVRHQGRIGAGKLWVSGTNKVGIRIAPDSLDGGWIGAPGP